jgi:hypothetical protein
LNECRAHAICLGGYSFFFFGEGRLLVDEQKMKRVLSKLELARKFGFQEQANLSNIAKLQSASQDNLTRKPRIVVLGSGKRFFSMLFRLLECQADTKLLQAGDRLISCNI